MFERVEVNLEYMKIYKFTYFNDLIKLFFTFFLLCNNTVQIKVCKNKCRKMFYTGHRVPADWGLRSGGHCHC